jgi:ABC-2 type transport system ATP-binding protein
LLLKEIYEVPDKEYKRRVDALCSLMEITHLLNTQVRKLSLGERMKCELVASLFYNPRIVFLDEPTIGLDVVSQKKVREFLKHYQPETGSTIILTSHYMQDIQDLCERVIIIDHGEMIFDDPLDVLVQRYSDVKRLSLVFSEPVAPEALAAYGSVIELSELRAVLEIARAQVTQSASQILAQLPVVDIAIEDVEADEIIRQIFTRRSELAA